MGTGEWAPRSVAELRAPDCGRQTAAVGLWFVVIDGGGSRDEAAVVRRHGTAPFTASEAVCVFVLAAVSPDLAPRPSRPPRPRPTAGLRPTKNQPPTDQLTTKTDRRPAKNRRPLTGASVGRAGGGRLETDGL